MRRKPNNHETKMQRARAALNEAGQLWAGDKLTVALQRLQQRIASGEEFPDACYRTAATLGIDYEALADAYDADDNARLQRD